MQILTVDEAIEELKKPTIHCDLVSVIKFLKEYEALRDQEVWDAENAECPTCQDYEQEIHILSQNKEYIEGLRSELDAVNRKFQRLKNNL